VYLGCALALAALWRQDERQPRRIGILAIAVATVAVVAFIFVGAGREPFLYALGLCAAGLPIYAATRWRRRTTMDKAMPE
jgi:APA family basic amino acid/polyamine antiporter